MGRKRDKVAAKKKREEKERLKRKAVIMLARGVKIRDVAEELGAGKSTVSRWYKEFKDKAEPIENRDEEVEQIAAVVKAPKAVEPETIVNDRQAAYVDNLRTVKNRQSKWAGAITETGIRSLKLANQYLAIAESKGSDGKPLSSNDIVLIKLIPSLMASSTQAVKSASEAIDRAYSLDKLVTLLDELPKQIQARD